jgi:alpha-amylase
MKFRRVQRRELTAFIKRTIGAFCLAGLLLGVWGGEAARAQNDAMLQAFYWNVPKKDANNSGWWNLLTSQATTFKQAGFTAIWTPPPSKGNFGLDDVGYGIFDHFDLGNYNQKGTTETRYGSRTELDAMLAAMHNQNIEVYTDTVLNHVFTDYHELESNPAVRAYVYNYSNNVSNKIPYPNNEIVWRLPNALPGDYYVQIEGYNLPCGDYNNLAYQMYATWTNPDPKYPYQPNVSPTPPYTGNFEIEPNNGLGSGTNVFPGSGKYVYGHISPCGDVDEYKITIPGSSAADAHDLNIILQAMYGNFSDTTTSGNTPPTYGDQTHGFRLKQIYGPTTPNGPSSTNLINNLQALTYTGINYAANYGVTHTGAGERNWTWNYTHFHPVDANDFITSDPGAGVVPNAKLFGEDLNTFDVRPNDPNDPTGPEVGVQNRLIYWGQWLANTVGFDGYRLDFVRGYQTGFAAQWVNAMPLKSNGQRRFVVGEYFSGNKAEVANWVRDMINQGAVQTNAFDFPLKYTLNSLCNANGAQFDMATLNHAGLVRDNSGNNLSGVNVVTFVDNHDTGKDHNQWIFKDWQMAYAYLLFSEGRPCVFYPHFYGITQVDDNDHSYTTTAPASLQTKITQLINIRRTYLDGDSIVLTEIGHPSDCTNNPTCNGSTHNLYVARRRGNPSANKPGAILVINNDDTTTRSIYVDNAPAGSGYVDWAGKTLRDLTGNSPDTPVYSDGRVLVQAPPRGYSIYVPVNLIAPTAANVAINGTIRRADGQPLAGVLVELDNESRVRTITDAQGHYSFANLAPTGVYTLTPTRADYQFTPPSRLLVLSGKNAQADFEAQTRGGALNPIDEMGFFIRQQYVDFLNREPDATGFNFWYNQIAACGGDAQCIDIKRQNVSAAYFLSREFQETGFFVIRLQRAAFGRVSRDAARRISYQQFVTDAQVVGAGVVDGQLGADALLEQNKTNYARAVVESPAFAARYPIGLSAAQFVDALYQTAGVTPTSGERQDAMTAFGSGSTAGRAAVLKVVAESNAIKQTEFAPAFVLMQYFGYLRRNPTDLPDTSDTGYQFWLSKLNAFGGDYIRSEMTRSFLISAEYRQRFGNM